MRYISKNVVLAVQNGERRDSFAVHELQGVCKRPITTGNIGQLVPPPASLAKFFSSLDGNDCVGPQIEFLQRKREQLLQCREVPAILPEELDER